MFTPWAGSFVYTVIAREYLAPNVLKPVIAAFMFSKANISGHSCENCFVGWKRVFTQRACRVKISFEWVTASNNAFTRKDIE